MVHKDEKVKKLKSKIAQDKAYAKYYQKKIQ